MPAQYKVNQLVEWTRLTTAIDDWQATKRRWTNPPLKFYLVAGPFWLWLGDRFILQKLLSQRRAIAAKAVGSLGQRLREMTYEHEEGL